MKMSVNLPKQHVKLMRPIRAKARMERVKAEEARKAEYGGIVDEMNQATEDATAQLGLVKTATDNANAAATLATKSNFSR